MSVTNHLIVDQGDTRRWTVTFYNSSNALANPTTVTFLLRTPSQAQGGGTSVTTGWTSPSTGIYYRDISFSEAGLYLMEARGAGNSVDQTERLIVDVTASRVS